MAAQARSRPHRGGSNLRDGFAVLGVAIRRERRLFVVSTIGAVVFGALTVADAWVLGWSADHVILPAFHSGVAPLGGLLTAWSDVLNKGMQPEKWSIIFACAWAFGILIAGGLFFVSREREFAVRL